MARIITFAETTPALLAGHKTVTRREWNHRYGESFYGGELLQAWDKNPRTRKGRRVALIRLTEKPHEERANAIRPPDWDAEGFEYMTEQGLMLFGGETPRMVYHTWLDSTDDVMLWVVRFKLEEVL